MTIKSFEETESIVILANPRTLLLNCHPKWIGFTISG